MASFSGPKLSNRIADDVPDIQAVLSSLAKLTPDSGNTDYPIGTKRVAETTNGYEFQQYNGTGWVTLEKWNIDAQKVDGYSASTGTTANTIPVRDANGKLPGDILGNATTATTATALSNANPIATGGTGATTAEQARTNLDIPPKTHASTSTEYGIGTSTQYGHLKSHDAPDSTLTAASGHAFSPAGAVSLDTSLRALIAEQDATITAVQTTADSKQDALGFTPIQQGGGAGQSGSKVRIGWSGTGLKLQVDETDLGTFAFSVNGTTADASGNVTINTNPTAGTGISVSGKTVSLATVVTAGNAGPTANASPAAGGTFTVPYITYDAYGRVTGRTNRTITLPAAPTSVTKAACLTNICSAVKTSAGTSTTSKQGSCTVSTKSYNKEGDTFYKMTVTLPSGGSWHWVSISGSNYKTGRSSGGTAIEVGDIGIFLAMRYA